MLPVRYSSFIDFKTFSDPGRLNTALACPIGWRGDLGGISSDTYKISSDRLFHAAKDVLKSLPRVTLLATDELRGQIVAVQRSYSIGFPDTIWIQVVEIKGRTGFVIFSRSNYGFWDAGVNVKRVKNLLKLLNLKLRQKT